MSARDERRKLESDRAKVFGEVRDRAQSLGLKNARVLSRLDLSSIVVGDDGEVDDRDVIDFVRGVKRDCPEFFKDEKSRADDQMRQELRRAQPAVDDKGTKINWASLTPEQFAATEKAVFGFSSRRFN